VPGVTLPTPTECWEEALITGNGRQGALCYGGPAGIRVTLAHERLFLPLNRPLDPPETASILPDLRALLYAGRYQEAADLVVAHAARVEPQYGELRWIDPFIGAATLTLAGQPPGPSAARDFRRSTDYTTGVVTQEWTTNAGSASVEVFVSRVHDVVVVRLRGPGPWRLRLAPLDGTPPRPVETRVVRDGDRIVLEADFPQAWPGALAGYAVTCRMVNPELLLLRTVPGGPPASLHDVPASFDALLDAHAATHGELFGRVRLDLGGGEVIPTLFDAARYAIISSCGERPPVLQGVWSGSYDPAWSSGYTIDGNLQAAVAALLPTACPELLLPVFDLVDDVLDDLRLNARRLYGAPGILTPVHLSTHGRQNHFAPVWCQTFWTAGAAWLARLYVDYWSYTGDDGFLSRRALPFMREAAQFYLHFAQRRADGRFALAPSYSPENAPANTGSQACVNATMDLAAVGDLLRNLLALDGADPAAPRWRELLDGLAPYRIGRGGELAEWAWPDLGDTHAHRHASHLFPLWYEPDPAITADPALRAAAVETVRRRLAFWRSAESDDMAYGLAQVGLAAAALRLGEEAYETLTLMAERYWRPSLVSTHNRGAIFNVDLCGGLPAVVAAMLVQSGGGAGPAWIELLPALPAAWPTGTVDGLAARGQVRLRRLRWAGRRIEAVLHSSRDRQLTIGLPGGRRIDVRLVADRPVRVAATVDSLFG
jgi:alpha-L-fucosidase 2